MGLLPLKVHDGPAEDEGRLGETQLPAVLKLDGDDSRDEEEDLGEAPKLGGDEVDRARTSERTDLAGVTGDEQEASEEGNGPRPPFDGERIRGGVQDRAMAIHFFSTFPDLM